MTLKVIEIENVKGIKKYSFNLDILPNKPSILVAPNGFGKSSFAAAFNLLQANGLVLSGYSLYKNDTANRPRLFIKYQKPDNTIVDLEADESINTIKDQFDCFVINSQIDAKGTGVNYGSEMTINPVILIDEIPEKVKFQYSFKSQQKIFGLNNKVLPNIKLLLSNSKLIKKINENITILTNALESQIQRKISEFVNEVNQESGTSSNLIEWIERNKIDSLNNIDCLSDLSQILYEFNFFNLKAEYFLAGIQIINLYNDSISDFEKACKYKIYELDKENYKSTLKAFNSTWRDIRIKESGKQLIVEFPEFHYISNGERDILTFVALLQQAKRRLKKHSNILVIDEVFDYLDDASLIAVQYYITQFIEEYSMTGRRIYPLILTHLNPDYFRNFTFSKQKIYYLDRRELKVNQHLVKLLINREHPSIQDDVSKYLFHFHTSCINKRQEFRALSLKETWGEGYNFDGFIDTEMRKYLNRKADYDPFAVCCTIRKRIEKLIYGKIVDMNSKTIFLDTHTTSKKLDFAESIGVIVPEAYYLLGIIYNDGMHWKKGQENVSQIAAKLENLTIRYLIKDVFAQ
ncbi:hypothetical protein [Nostoc sp. LEGE 12450]|uniref:hypothetical protein n=1 Tax=Nostoc sp. LEGE 12450 TaxID=1828643 RepID=UPI00187E0349|nr:hypothetical protein [Nostoc sp. LEGE 12450]MBE8987642.1 hypothetical protein [Nostoc sp. LEGE 12450]